MIVYTMLSELKMKVQFQQHVPTIGHALNYSIIGALCLLILHK